MKIRKIIPAILLAGMVFSGVTPTHNNVSYVFAETQQSIIANDVTFTSEETDKKQIDFTLTGIPAEKIGFEYESGAFRVNALGEITPLDIGKGTVKIFYVDDTSIYTTINVSVWMDRLPEPPNVDLSASSTEDSITILNNSTDIPMGSYFEYSLNGVLWQKENEFKGLKDETEYSVYARCLTSDGYVFWEPEEAYLTISTKKKEVVPETEEYTYSDITLREGNLYEINLTNFEDKEITSFGSNDKNVAELNVTTENGKRKAVITAKNEGETSVYLIFDYSTETKAKYIKYIFPVKVTPVPKVNFSFNHAEYEKVYLDYDSSNAPEGCVAKFSFDKSSWVAGNCITRKIGNAINQTTVYAAYFDSNGYMRSIITELDLSKVLTVKETTSTENKSEISLKSQDEHDFYIEGVKNEKEITFYNYNSSDTKVAFFYKEGLLFAASQGSTTVKVIKNSSYLVI